MAKRFTATEKWADPWFCSLSVANKLFWIYLLDNCDHAGIWQVNMPLVDFHFRGKGEIDFAPFESRVIKLSEEKWFIPKFIEFQYGDLKSDNRAHQSVLRILEKEGASKDLPRPLLGHTLGPTLGRKDKDKDKDKDQDKITRRNFSEGDFSVAEEMFQLIRALNPEHKKPNLEAWAEEIRLIRERDGKSIDTISELFRWANSHPFWKANILSPATLRKQWDKLTLQKSRDYDRGQEQEQDQEAYLKAYCGVK